MAVKRWNGTAWEVYAGADVVPVKVTDGRPGKTTFIGATTPTGQVDGDIWIDQDTTTNAVVPTALTTKGDTFVATGNAAYTRLAAGNNGESLFADSSTSTGLRWQGDFNTGKNKIINGDFSIWQRGTSFTLSTGAVTFTADRFFMVMPGGTVVTRETFVPGEAPVAGYEGKHYIRTVINTNAQNYESGFRIEDVRTLAGQTATLSFWARSTAGAAALGYAIFQNFGTGGSPSSMVQATQITGSGPYTPTSQWQRYSYTFSIPSISGKTIGTNDNSYLLVRPFQFNTTATNTSVDIWGVQLEAGSIATPFTTATGTIQGELAACQRYYYKAANPATNYPFFGNYIAQSTSLAVGQVMIPVPMRLGSTSLSVALQSAGGYRLTNNANYTASSIGYDTTYVYAAQNSVPISVGSSGLTAGAMYFLVGNFNSNAAIEISAEL